MRPRAAVALTVLLSASSVRADPGAARAALAESGLFLGASLDEVPAAPVAAPKLSTAAPEARIPADEQVNFDYADMVDRMEGMSRTVIGRRKKKRRIDTGVTPADRVDRGEIKYVVLHASGGATGKPKACEGSVSWLLQQKTAAHFMVCRDGRVIRMVKIENIANQVKNTAIDEAAVGIETESGHPEASAPFLAEDWDPDAVWRMYASIAWLTRAIAKEVSLPRDRAHVITHEEADRGIPRAHVDPGPFFDSQTYPAFDARFPGQNVTPREFLMRLIADDTPPQIWMVAGSTAEVEIKSKDGLGLAHVRVWKLDAAGKAKDLKQDWSAPVAGLPPSSLKIAVPSEPGSYRVVARDLVGNTSAGLVKIPDPAAPQAPAIAGAKSASLEPVAVLAALEDE